MTYDPVEVYRTDDDDAAASNGLTFQLLVHKVILIGQAANAVTLALHDAATVTGNPKIEVQTSITGDTEAEAMKDVSFFPPVPFNQLSANIGGTNAVAYVYYTRR